MADGGGASVGSTSSCQWRSCSFWARTSRVDQELLLTLRSRLRRVDEGYLVTKLHLKIKFADFQLTSAECSGRDLQEGAFASLLEEALGRSDQSVRLLGVGVRFVDLREQTNPAQYELFEREQALT